MCTEREREREREGKGCVGYLWIGNLEEGERFGKIICYREYFDNSLTEICQELTRIGYKGICAIEFELTRVFVKC